MNTKRDTLHREELTDHYDREAALLMDEARRQAAILIEAATIRVNQLIQARAPILPITHPGGPERLPISPKKWKEPKQPHPNPPTNFQHRHTTAPHPYEKLEASQRMTPGLKDLCAEYLRERDQQRDPPYTIQAYRVTFTWLATTSASVADFSRDDLLNRLIAQSPQHWKQTTRTAHLRHVCTFARWLKRRGLCDRDHHPAPARRQPQFRSLPTDAELATLREYAATKVNDSSPGRIRERRQHQLILELLIETGARIGELIRLDRNSITAHPHGHYLTLLGTKSRDSERGIEITEQMADALNAFLTTHQSPHAPLFQNQHGHRLTPRAFNEWLSETSKHLKLKTHLHPHLFRYRYIVERILAGDDPFEVRRRVGHRDLQMTLYYFDQVERMLPFTNINPWRKPR